MVPDAASGRLPFVRVDDLADVCTRIVELGGAAEDPVLRQGTAGTRWCATDRACRSPSTVSR